MEIKRVNCPACNGPISVMDNSNKLDCPYCGTGLIVEFDDDKLSISTIKEFEKAIRETGEQTNSTILESTKITQTEFQKLHLQQKISTIQNQISSINSEIRTIERGKRNIKQRKQLRELKNEKENLTYQIKHLLVGSDENVSGSRIQSKRNTTKDSGFKAGCISLIIALFIAIGIFGSIGMFLDRILFRTTTSSGPFFSIASLVSFIIALLTFIYRYKPNSKISILIKEKIEKIFPKQIPKWVIIGGLAFLSIICVTFGAPTASEVKQDSSPETSQAATQTTIEKQPTQGQIIEPTTVVEVSPKIDSYQIEPGTYLVNKDIQPGVYKGREEQGSFGCYWARLKDLSGEIESILSNDNSIGQFYIEIKESDYAFETACGLNLIDSVPEIIEDFPAVINPGTYIIGRDIEPGTYKGQANNSNCYWARLNNVSGDMESIIANDIPGGQFYLQVVNTDFALTTNCELERVGD